MSTGSEVVQLQIHAREEDFVGFFDELEVWRSTTTSSGPYEELTAESWKPARIPKDASDPPPSPIVGPSINIVDDSLSLKVDGKTLLTVTFSGTDPLTLTEIALQIISGGAGYVSAYVATGGILVIETAQPGSSAMLEVIGGAAAAKIGLPTEPPASLSVGKNPRIGLMAGTDTYQFTDFFSASEYFYKTRFRNRLTSAVSEFSHPFQPTSSLGIDQDLVVLGRVRLVDMDGKPLVNREIRVFTPFNASSFDGLVVAGRSLSQRTDENGHAEFSLIRGQKITVAVIGTDLVRQLTVPTEQSVKTFHLLDPNIGDQEDYFRVRVDKISLATRRSF